MEGAVQMLELHMNIPKKSANSALKAKKTAFAVFIIYMRLILFLILISDVNSYLLETSCISIRLVPGKEFNRLGFSF